MDWQTTRFTPALLLTFGLACAAQPGSEPHGRAAFALQTTTPSGSLYRLVDAEFLERIS